MLNWFPRSATLALLAGALTIVTAVPALAGAGTVTGTLYDDDTGWVASGILVHACGPQGCMGTAVSGPGGQYSLDLPSGGGWNVFTDGGCGVGDYARGHQYSVNVSTGIATVVNIHLTKRKGSIGGRVVDGSGAILPNVSLVVDNAETGGSGLAGATSGADGTFAVNCLAAAGTAGTGTYYITAFPPSGSAHGQQQDAGIKVRPDLETPHDVVLGDGSGSFSGRITCGTDPCGRGVSVLVYCEGCGSAATVATDATGTYVTGPLQPGHKYDIHAVGPPGWDNQITYGVPVGSAGATRVDVPLTPAGPATSGGLGGTVTDGDTGYANCLINAFGGTAGRPGGGWIDGDVYTAGDGTFDSGYRLVPGDYLVFIVCPGHPQVRANDGHPIHVDPGMTAMLGYAFPEPPRIPEPRNWILHVPSKERPLE